MNRAKAAGLAVNIVSILIGGCAGVAVLMFGLTVALVAIERFRDLMLANPDLKADTLWWILAGGWIASFVGGFGTAILIRALIAGVIPPRKAG